MRYADQGKGNSMSVTEPLESRDMSSTNDERGDVPLYVKVPATAQDYLSTVKQVTGITKTDSVTLILEVAAKFIPVEKLSKMFDDYTLLGPEGLDLFDICGHRPS